MSNKEYDYILIYIMIGDAKVGKSSLSLNYARHKFNPEYVSTLSVEFFLKDVHIRNKVYHIQLWDTPGKKDFFTITKAYFKNTECALVVYDIRFIMFKYWDTSGSKDFLSQTEAYYKNTACTLIVYDITDRNSFDNVTFWVEGFKNETIEKVLIVLVGNKSDLNNKRQVSTEEGQDLADKLGISFFETSAKTGENVENIFFKSTDEIAKRIDDNYYDLEYDICGIRKGKKLNN